MYLPLHRIHIPVYLDSTNMPVVHNSFVTEHQKRAIGNQMHSLLSYSILSELDIYGDLNTNKYIQDMDIYSKQIKIKHEF